MLSHISRYFHRLDRPLLFRLLMIHRVEIPRRRSRIAFAWHTRPTAIAGILSIADPAPWLVGVVLADPALVITALAGHWPSPYR